MPDIKSSLQVQYMIPNSMSPNETSLKMADVNLPDIATFPTIWRVSEWVSD